MVVEEQARIKVGIEKMMKWVLKDIQEGDLRIKLLSLLVQVRELLNGDKPTSSN